MQIARRGKAFISQADDFHQVSHFRVIPLINSNIGIVKNGTKLLQYFTCIITNCLECIYCNNLHGPGMKPLFLVTSQKKSRVPWKMERRVEIGGKYLQVDVAANVWEVIVKIILLTGDSDEQKCHAKAKAATGSKLEVGIKS